MAKHTCSVQMLYSCMVCTCNLQSDTPTR